MQHNPFSMNQIVASYLLAESRAFRERVNGVMYVHFDQKDKDKIAKMMIDGDHKIGPVAGHLADLELQCGSKEPRTAIKSRHHTRLAGFIDSYKRRTKAEKEEKREQQETPETKEVSVKMNCSDLALFKSNIITSVGAAYRSCAKLGILESEWNDLVVYAVDVAKTSIRAERIEPGLTKFMNEHGVTKDQLVELLDILG